MAVYDPRCRAWYLGALDSAGEAVVSSYVSVDGQTVFTTISKIVRNLKTDEIIGVAGMDLDPEQIERLMEGTAALQDVESLYVATVPQTFVIYSRDYVTNKT